MRIARIYFVRPSIRASSAASGESLPSADMKKHLLATIVVVVILAIAVVVLWRHDKLNKFLPDKWKHKSKAGFRGAFGRSPEMTKCAIGGTLAFGLNACQYA
jgi:hypothetical protein